MPLYACLCERCDHKFERIVPSARSPLPCHICGYEARKLPSSPAFKVEGYSAKNNYSGDTK